MEIATRLWIFVFSLLAIIIVLSLIYCAAIFKRHRAHKKRDIALYEQNATLPTEIKNMYISLVERRYSTIQNYFIYQIINKVFGFTGVIYSVLGFGVGLIDTSNMDAFSMKYLCAAISLVSIISVIIALYMSPTKRVTEYINAWRLYDKKVSEISGQLSMYTQLENKDLKLVPTIDEPFGLMPHCNSKKYRFGTFDITSELSQFIFEVESSINSECE